MCYLYFFCLHCCLINIHIFDYPDSRLSGFFSEVPTSLDNRGSTVPVRRSNKLSYEAIDVGSWSFVTVSNPVEVLTFSGFYTQLLKLRSYNCDDHGLLDFKSAVQYMKHFIDHFKTNLVCIPLSQSFFGFRQSGLIGFSC